MELCEALQLHVATALLLHGTEGGNSPTEVEFTEAVDALLEPPSSSQQTAPPPAVGSLPQLVSQLLPVTAASPTSWFLAFMFGKITSKLRFASQSPSTSRAAALPYFAHAARLAKHPSVAHTGAEGGARLEALYRLHAERAKLVLQDGDGGELHRCGVCPGLCFTQQPCCVSSQST